MKINPEEILLTSKSDSESKLLDISINLEDSFPDPDNIEENPFSAYITTVPEGFGVIAPYLSTFENLLTLIESSGQLPRGGRFVWGNELEELPLGQGQYIGYKPIYYISDNPHSRWWGLVHAALADAEEGCLRQQPLL